jgi:dTDP-4-dehydrorhamnose 3,5-epimerase
MIMAEITESPLICGVKFVRFQQLSDERGSFTETFRKAWFPERSWQSVQVNLSRSRAHVLRGLHYHHQQADYWYVPQGLIRVGLVDLRRGSPSQGTGQTVEMGDALASRQHGDYATTGDYRSNPMGVFIPVGVAHGFFALTDVILTYLVDNYYNASDELGVAWNDPALHLNWRLGDITPILSPRDRKNPLLDEIPPERLPMWQSA